MGSAHDAPTLRPRPSRPRCRGSARSAPDDRRRRSATGPTGCGGRSDPPPGRFPARGHRDRQPGDRLLRFARGRRHLRPVPRSGDLPDPSEIVTLPLTGEWVQQEGFNANGIALTTNRQALLGGYSLVNGDGLLMVNRTLYVVQNRLNQWRRSASTCREPWGGSRRSSRVRRSVCRRRWPRIDRISTCRTPDSEPRRRPRPTTTRCVWIADSLQGRTPCVTSSHVTDVS